MIQHSQWRGRRMLFVELGNGLPKRDLLEHGEYAVEHPAIVRRGDQQAGLTFKLNRLQPESVVHELRHLLNRRRGFLHRLERAQKNCALFGQLAFDPQRSTQHAPHAAHQLVRPPT